jgi:hypothetical protein
MYSTTDEFVDAYEKGLLNEFNKLLYEDYIYFNSDDLFNYNVELQYKDGCDCEKDDSYDPDDCETCDCGNDINYWDDKFMWNKIPMFPENMKLQKYYEKIFPKRIFNNKIFYYLPNGCISIYTTYIDETLTETFDIKRSITYRFIDELVLVEDKMDAWFGSMFKNYHTSESEHFAKYIDKLNEYEKNNDLDDRITIMEFL